MDISLSLLQPAYTILHSSQQNSSPDRGALLTQLPHIQEGRVGLRPQYPQLCSPRPSAQLLQAKGSSVEAVQLYWAGFRPKSPLA